MLWPVGMGVAVWAGRAGRAACRGWWPRVCRRVFGTARRALVDGSCPKAAKLRIKGRCQGPSSRDHVSGWACLGQQPSAGPLRLCTQKLLRPLSPVMPRVRAISRARHARSGVERKRVRTAGRRLGGRIEVLVRAAATWGRLARRAGWGWRVAFAGACRAGGGWVGWQTVT